MPGAPQGLFSFPGVEDILSGNFTFCHGISPSTASVQIAPQAGLIPTSGKLTLTFGTEFRLEFPNCRVNAPTIQYGIDGRIMSFGIQDRRWKWAFGEIYGRYNLKRSDGTIDELRSTEKTPQELAKLLLDAMHEEGADVSALPNKLRPEKVWDGHNPAEELAQLCDMLGCRVVLGLDNRVRLVKLGEGADLPGGDTRRTTGYGMELTGTPDSLKVVCGPHLFQTKLKLEAVGLDNDGRIKPVDKLSYKPAAGWSTQYPEGFFKVTNLADRRLAVKTVWRWYRIVSQADGTMEPPGWPKDEPVTSIQQLLPIRGKLLVEQLDRQRDANDLQTAHFLPAYVEGSFLKRNFDFGSSLEYTDIQKGATTDANGNTTIGARYVGGFSIDEERGIVQFSDWVVKRAAAGGYTGAELYLTCSYACTNESHLPLRHGQERRISERSQGTGPRIIPADDIQRFIVAEYGPDGKRIKTVRDNVNNVNKWCRELLDQAEAEYQSPETEEVEYAGWLRIDLDGKIQQVAWSFGKNGAITQASSNTEFDLAVPPYKQLREQQRARILQQFVFREPVIVGAK